MALVSLSVRHGCGFCAASREFPDILLTTWPLHFQRTGERVFAAIKMVIRGPSASEIEAFLDVLLKKENVSELRRLRNSDTVVECVANFETNCDSSPAYAFITKEAAVLKVEFRDGDELITADIADEKVDSLVGDIARKWPCKIEKHRNLKQEENGGLTSKEVMTLKMARRFGYYNEKHKITLEELAAKCKISKAAYRNNLRRAERKLFTKMIEEL